MKLVLPRQLRVAIEREARAAFPRECCGLIEGVREGKVARAVDLYAGRNISTFVDRFEIDPRDHFAALKAARTHGHDLIGCYHSHPGGLAKPSRTDLLGAGEEAFLWLIAALPAASGPFELGAFIYAAAEFFPAELDEGERARS
jgi:desampylase